MSLISHSSAHTLLSHLSSLLPSLLSPSSPSPSPSSFLPSLFLSPYLSSLFPPLITLPLPPLLSTSSSFSPPSSSLYPLREGPRMQLMQDLCLSCNMLRDQVTSYHTHLCITSLLQDPAGNHWSNGRPFFEVSLQHCY